MGYQTILFDLDGTLIDFKKAEEMSFHYTFKHNNIVIEEGMFSRYHEINSGLWDKLQNEEITKEELVVVRFANLFGEYNITADPAEINRQYLSNLALEVFHVSGAIPLLEELRDDFNLSVITNGVSGTQHKRLLKGDLLKYFHHIIVSEDAGAAKPSTQFFDYAFSKIGEVDPATVLVVGDSLTADIQGAMNYGIDCCFYNPDDLDYTGYTPKYVIKNLYELLDILLPERERYPILRKHYLDCNLNCAESVFLALTEEKGIPVSHDAVRAIGAFGGGIGCGETCGALAGLVGMLGLENIDTDAHASTTLKPACTKAIELWKKQFGSLRCADIKGKYMQDGLRCYKTCEYAVKIYHQCEKNRG